MPRWLRSELERAARVHPLGMRDRRTVWAACSTLLDYPTEELLGNLDALDGVLGTLPATYSEPLGRLVGHLRSDELRALQEEYVATFDHTRRCALYLTYFGYGDTRRRGVALVQFKQAYRKAGVEFDPEQDGDELPDHLCAVLQFGATVDAEAAWRLLLDHRAGVEMLRLALAEADSPWHDALVALCATLPALRGDEAEAVQRLIAQGPPAEEVGLQPYLIDPQIPVGAPR
ncbi:MAG TPA: nitrate reductase molybdenum cofactor assembly chaperone [Nocardioides sp.]|uniref:nitrate reductase molybdenum cofactor assembly chaperone n=1 Tax=Nocardioides sp. TaxID=35761 RepID=UPI002B981F76|nr:nitrate reductase molybdenum cofactor assembly chaperone [Nocardioides sp.]HQR27266.1 nitrate reductase molybdenum cofactor assembly chaperone [Nocardioides sp.]